MAAEDLTIESLRGGLNDSVPAHALKADECTEAMNVEWFHSTLGERRNGCGPFSMVGSGLEHEATIVHLSEWFPNNAVLTPELLAIAATPGVSVSVAAFTEGAWTALTPTDPILSASPDVYDVQAQSLNGKDFLAYPSDEDRLHVLTADGTWRRTGLPEPTAAPTGANTGSGSYATIRYFRVRWIEKSGTLILRRSEPSTSLAFTPSGSGTGVIVTRPTYPTDEGITHWELEASTDTGGDGNYYILATTAIATTTVTDSIAFATGYADSGDLSEDIGEYQLQSSCRYLAVDGDRLLMGGHFTDATKQSQIAWSPVSNDPGFGNDERVALSMNSTVNLDNYDGGALTGIAASTYGTWYAFKWQRIYRMTRTGDRIRAYVPLTISTTRGAINGSPVRGSTESGDDCIYFLDPYFGPSRIGPMGLQALSGLRTTWARVNLRAADVIARGVYYPAKQQLHWWVAVDGSDTPTLKIVLQVSELQVASNGIASRGWSLADGRIAEATAVCLFTEWATIDDTITLSQRPFIGLTAPDYIQRCDTEATDAGQTYTATIKTRPFFVTGLLNSWGAMTAALLASANATASVVVKFISNFGLNSASVTTTLTPTDTEDLVIKPFDNLAMSESKSIQITFTDVS